MRKLFLAMIFLPQCAIASSLDAQGKLDDQLIILHPNYNTLCNNPFSTACQDFIVSDKEFYMKSPLSSMNFSTGAEFSLPKHPKLIFNAIIGRNSKHYGLGVGFMVLPNLKIGLSFAKMSGKSSLFTGFAAKKSMSAFMTNFTYYWPEYKIITPYIGATVGYAQHDLLYDLSYKIYYKDKYEELNRNQYNSLVYGLDAGLKIKINDNIFLDLGYKMTDFGFKTIKTRLSALSTIRAKSAGLQHNFVLSVKVKF